MSMRGLLFIRFVYSSSAVCWNFNFFLPTQVNKSDQKYFFWSEKASKIHDEETKKAFLKNFVSFRIDLCLSELEAPTESNFLVPRSLWKVRRS